MDRNPFLAAKARFLNSEKYSETYGVLCPSCKKFSSAALERYLPGGPKAGLKKMAATTFFKVSFLQLVPFFTVPIFWNLFRTIGVQFPWRYVVFAAVLLLPWFGYRLSKYLRLKKIIEGMSPAVAANALRSEYELTNIDSMTGLFHRSCEKPNFSKHGRITDCGLGLVNQDQDSIGRTLGMMLKRLSLYANSESSKQRLPQTGGAVADSPTRARKRRRRKKLPRPPE